VSTSSFDHVCQFYFELGWDGIIATILGVGFQTGSEMGKKFITNEDGDGNRNYMMRMEMSGRINHIFSHF